MTEVLEPVFRFLRIRETSRFVDAGSRVCDIGCGKNYIFLKAIKKKVKNGIGLDKEVEDKEEGNIRLISADIEGRMPVINMKFNHVTMLAVFEHMKNPEKVLENCYGMLEGGGTLIITTPSIKSRKKLELLARIGLISRKEIFDHKHYFTYDELYGVLEKSGFEIIKMKTFEFGNNILAVGRKA